MKKTINTLKSIALLVLILVGSTVASVITQIIPTAFDKDFGDIDNIVDETGAPVEALESVKIFIPYFSTKVETDANGNGTYELDSIFGNPNAEFKLSIYKSNYLLRSLDPSSNFEDAQAYYSNQEELFCNQIGELLNDNSINFTLDAREIRLDENGNTVAENDTDTEIVERFPPRLEIDINPGGGFWENLLFANQGNPVLSNISNFTEFFRGLIFKVEEINPTQDSSFVILNFNDGDAKVVVDYTNQEEQDAIAEGTSTSALQTFLSFTFNGLRANTLNTSGITTDLNGDAINGDSNLYLKGLDGTMAVLDLFNGDVINDDGQPQNALDFFNSKKEKWLINEANLVFYVDQTNVMGDEPERILLMDLKNNTPIVDYFLDGSTNATNPSISKFIHSEILEKDSDEKGVKYKFRLTNHINNMLLRDSTNVKLGLYVASNINITQNSIIQNPDMTTNTVLTEIPTSSVMTPKGTILHGSLPSLPEGQRAEFEIFYTEPEN